MRHPQRGDIWFVDLEPVTGREINKLRPVFIVSPQEINKLGLTLIAPITGGAAFDRNNGFTVPLTGLGLKTQGLVLCRQIRVVDLVKRKARYEETVDQTIVEVVIAKITQSFALE